MFLASVGFVVGSFLLNQDDIQQFTEKGIAVYGKVTSKEPDNHQVVRYSYNVGDRRYTGAGNAGRGNPNFDQIQIGQQIIVYYDSENPEKSILGYPQYYASTNHIGVLFVTIFFPVFPMIVIYMLYRLFFYRKFKIIHS